MYLAMQDCDSQCPVHLTQTAPLTTSPDDLISCNIVDVDTVSRSSVLSCIAEAGGDARLPEAVTVAEFKAWVSAGAASKQHVIHTPFSTLCTIVKVCPLATTLGGRDSASYRRNPSSHTVPGLHMELEDMFEKW